jgi:hypothetical protein
MNKLPMIHRVPSSLTNQFYKLFFKGNTIDFFVSLYIMESNKWEK